MLEATDIKSRHVYLSASGDRRLVTKVWPGAGKRPVVVWSTLCEALQPTQKAHGSCTLGSFRKWAVSCVAATNEDWELSARLEQVREWRNADKKAIARIRKATATQR